jgi:putative hemolysin
MGLEIMKYRARMIGGSLSHKKGKGQGSALVCVLPSPRRHPTKRGL